VARAEAYLHAKFHLDPSNCLATVHERYRQDRADNGPIALGERFGFAQGVTELGGFKLRGSGSPKF